MGIAAYHADGYPWGLSSRTLGGPGGGWLILPEPELHLGPDVLVPDRCRVGDRNGCHVPACLSHRSRRIGSAKSSRRQLSGSIARRSCASTRGRRSSLLADRSAQAHRSKFVGSKAAEWMMVARARDNEVIKPEPFDALPLPIVHLWKIRRLDQCAPRLIGRRCRRLRSRSLSRVTAFRGL